MAERVEIYHPLYQDVVDVDDDGNEIIAEEKGGEGSGNWGHGGLDGVWGGSTPTDGALGVDASQSVFEKNKYSAMSIPDRKKAFFSQSQHVVDAQTNASSSIQSLISERITFAGERPNTGDLRADIFSRVEQYGGFTTEANKNMILDTALELESVLEIAGVDDEHRRSLVMESLDALVVQDNEALSRQLGDHGIHHIRGNIMTSYEILKTVPGADSPEAIAEVYLAHIFHDTGYLTEPSRMFMDDAHPRWSRQHYDRNVKTLVAESLGKESAGNISYLIESHAGTTIDWTGDTIGSAVRVSDNLGLFQDDKLPELFRSVPQNIAVLEQLQLGNISESKANSLMIANINKLDFSSEVRTQLIKAARECNRFTPKFTLGMLGGNIEGFDWSPDGHLKVYLKKNSEATRLQKLMDLGQKQFAKLAKTYGVDWKSFRGSLSFTFPPAGMTLLEGIMVGEKERHALLKIFKGLFGG